MKGAAPRPAPHSAAGRESRTQPRRPRQGSGPAPPRKQPVQPRGLEAVQKLTLRLVTPQDLASPGCGRADHPA